MKDLITKSEFWVAMAFAIVLKISASKTLTPWRAATTIVISVTSALTFTSAVVEYFQLTGETMEIAAAALIALTFEHLSRQVLEIRLADLLKIWRGGK